MGISERELEDVIYFQYFQDVQDSGLSLFDHHVWGNSKIVRQLSLGSYGRPDLVGFNFVGEGKKLTEVYITIYELKVVPISFDALCQVQKYQYALRELLLNNPIYKGIDIQISTCLIGPSIDPCVDFMATAAELGIYLYTYESTAKGILFSQILTFQYKPDSYDNTWFGDGKKLNLFRLFKGDQDVIYDPEKNESWVSNLRNNG